MSTRLEVDTQIKQSRRRFTATFRRQVVEETLAGTASVSAVARRHDLNTNLLFKWRQQYRQALDPADTPALVPIRLAPPAPMTASCAVETRAPASDATGCIEITVAAGHRVTLAGAVDAALVRVVLAALT